MTLRKYVDLLYERYLKKQCIHVPNHIAIIQDGNRRFARMKKVDVSMGHRLGAQTTERMLDWAQELGIKHITLYTFSTENFKREHEELEELFALFKEKITDVTTDKRVHKYRIRVKIIGDKRILPDDLCECIEKAETATEDYGNFYLNVALAYGGRNEIVLAARSILTDVKKGILNPDEIKISTVTERLHDGLNLPPVDLIVRTGNDNRTSNFLPWLANGNESAVYFCAPYWPNFRKIDLLRGIRIYDQRVRSSHLPNVRVRN